MKSRRTRVWYLTRIELALAIGAILIQIALLLAPSSGPLFDPRPPLGPLPANLIAPLAALIPSLVGLGWMIRIVRGPRDEPPPWRYRDR
jgi:hypothetical protein